MRRAAFTLVELLVAVLLLTLLIGTALFAYRHILLHVKKTQTATIDRVLRFNQIRTTIESMQYYVIDYYDPLGNPMKKLHYFFMGNAKEFQYITSNSTFLKEPTLASFKCEDNKLYYTEEPFYSGRDLKRPKMGEDGKKKIYYNNLKRCNFKYITNNGEIKDTLQDTIPMVVGIYLIDSDNRLNSIYSIVKSDFNISKYYIDELLYDKL